MDSLELKWESCRRFGIEIETNADDCRDFTEYGLGPEELPLGIHRIGTNITSLLRSNVIVDRWHYTHHNEYWILKPDSSCGIEICSPVLRGLSGINECCSVINLLRDDENTKIDNRCSVHIHIEVNDLNFDSLAQLLVFWIKCEPVFIDAVPAYRKSSRYCKSIGQSITFYDFSPSVLIELLGKEKYYSMNTYHYYKRKRNTIEFRLLGHESCRDANSVANWIMLILHFVEMTKSALFRNFEGRQWHGYNWLNPKDVFKILGFDGEHNLSKELIDLRSWFLSILHKNVGTSKAGIWSKEARRVSYGQICEMMDMFGV